eukprot:scaffold47561_cov58-Phaeocystis_antarctica.AAC.2
MALANRSRVLLLWVQDRQSFFNCFGSNEVSDADSRFVDGRRPSFTRDVRASCLRAGALRAILSLQAKSRRCSFETQKL